MHPHTYRDEGHSRHFDLVSGGWHPTSIDVVAAVAAGILVVDFACTFMVSSGSTVPSLSAWVHQTLSLFGRGRSHLFRKSTVACAHRWPHVGQRPHC
jgi:hypothetical protein